MKKVFILLLIITSAYSSKLSNQDILDAANFLKLNSIPKIIQSSSYEELNGIKTNSPALNDKFAIQGTYIFKEKTLYLFDIKNIDLSKPACINTEKFMKTGFMVHELTHYKQDLEQIHKEDHNTSYEVSEREYEAFDQQLKYWGENLDLYNPFIKQCLGISSFTWYKNYLSNSKDVNKIFQEKRLKEILVKEENKNKENEMLKLKKYYKKNRKV